MAIYETRTFSRWVRKQKLDAAALCAAVSEMAKGLFEADLGGGVLKKRIARAGQGKSSGFRTLVATHHGDRWVFMFGFAKNERSNVDKDELEALKKLAEQRLGLTSEALQTALQADELSEGELR